MEKEICENCGRAIGKLEQAFVYKGHVVCKECNEKLSDKPPKIQPSPPKSRKAPCVTNSHPPKTLHKQNSSVDYMTRCGIRSFILQCCLLAWTIFMVYLTRDQLRRGLWGWFFWLWLLFAVPLGIAAIATFGRDKK